MTRRGSCFLGRHQLCDQVVSVRIDQMREEGLEAAAVDQ